MVVWSPWPVRTVARKVAGAGHDVPLWNRTRATAESVAEGHERLVVAGTAAEIRRQQAAGLSPHPANAVR